MDINFNIIELSQQVFGNNGYLLLPTQDDDKNEYQMPDSNNSSPVTVEYPTSFKTIEEEEIVEYSALGTPIYDVVEFKEDGNTVLRLVDLPLITVTRSKKVIMTEMEGRDGTVKEIICNSDFKISIQGLLSNDEERKKPWDKMQTLNNTFTKNKTYQVYSKLFARLGITDALFMDIDFTASQGFINIQPYQINLVSDDPIELQL